MDRKQPPKDRSNHREDRGTPPRPARPRRSGEGSESALASLKSIERERARSIPADDETPRGNSRR
jgi:hypothetical protein